MLVSKVEVCRVESVLHNGYLVRHKSVPYNGRTYRRHPFLTVQRSIIHIVLLYLDGLPDNCRTVLSKHTLRISTGRLSREEKGTSRLNTSRLPVLSLE
jgi:hypothetical protein